MGDQRGHSLVQVLSCVLSRLVQANDRTAASARVTKFHALRPPSISLRDYFERIYKYASCSSECFVLALVYIDRLIQSNNVVLCSLNVHRIVITSLMLAAKFFDDQYFNNAYYAKVGGVPCIEMNSLELEFLFCVNFSLFVPTDIYLKYNAELVNHVTHPTVACDCPAVFRAQSLHLGVPAIPPALPGPEEPWAPTSPAPAPAGVVVPPLSAGTAGAPSSGSGGGAEAIAGPGPGSAAFAAGPGAGAVPHGGVAPGQVAPAAPIAPLAPGREEEEEEEDNPMTGRGR